MERGGHVPALAAPATGCVGCVEWLRCPEPLLRGGSDGAVSPAAIVAMAGKGGRLLLISAWSGWGLSRYACVRADAEERRPGTASGAPPPTADGRAVDTVHLHSAHTPHPCRMEVTVHVPALCALPAFEPGQSSR